MNVVDNAMTLILRRSLLAGLFVAPAIIRPGLLMPVKIRKQWLSIPHPEGFYPVIVYHDGMRITDTLHLNSSSLWWDGTPPVTLPSRFILGARARQPLDVPLHDLHTAARNAPSSDTVLIPNPRWIEDRRSQGATISISHVLSILHQ